MAKTLGVAVLLLGISTALMAGFTSPEIDGSTGVAAVALIAGSILVIKGRRKK
jgi:hypothetical protein